MESKDDSVQETAGNAPELESLKRRLKKFITQIDLLEQKLQDAEHFYLRTYRKHPNTSEGGSVVGDEYREKLGESSKKRQLIAAHMEIANGKRMRELMHEFGTILHEIEQHKCAEPFMQPVDAIGFGLDDYYKVVEKPMDFSTIKKKMEAKDDAGYKNVQEICADVRLIFDNAMKYYKEGDDLHVMAKTLLDIFETRWLEFLPKLDEEEQRQKEEEAQMQQETYLAEEAFVEVIRDLTLEIDELDMEMEEVRDLVHKKYWRKMTYNERAKLRDAITQLPFEGTNEVVEFIAANDPNFQVIGETAEIDFATQSDSILWKLKHLVENRLQEQTGSSSSIGDDNEGNNLDNSTTGEQETCDNFTKD